MKLCSKCKEYKDKTLFGISKQKKDGLRVWCKTCHNNSNKKWRTNNPNYYKQRHDQNPERRKQYDLAYKTKNPNYLKNYYEKHKDIFIGRVISRRGRTKKGSVLWADQNKIRTYYRLASNLNKFHGYVKYHVDHVVPLKGKTVSGLHVHNNLKILLSSENKSKFNKWKS